MTIRITVTDGPGDQTLHMELEGETTMDEIIEAAADHWKKPQGAYVLRWGNALLTGDMRMDEAGLDSGERLELLLDPEGG